MRRRSFFRNAAAAGAWLGTEAGPALGHLYAFGQTANLSHVEARYYKRLADREIECDLCPRRCKLGDKERGYCGVRQNDGGTYYTLVYGKACSINVDPIEKKPFFHVLPGSNALSIATAGCNVSCKFCQNWEISQVRPEQIQAVDFPPSAVAEAAVRYGCPTIAYTYSEPTVFYEYMYDTAVESGRQGVRSVVVSGGHINPEPLEALTKVVAAIKIDLKSFSEDFYKTYVRGELKPVLEAIALIAKTKTWLEIVYLVIPTLNDGVEDIRRMSRWILKEAGAEIPLHFTQFHPMYLIKNLPPTPISVLEKLRAAALQEGLHYVYTGNVPGHKAENTYCPKCQTMVIERSGYKIVRNDLRQGACPNCQNRVPGIWT